MIDIVPIRLEHAEGFHRAFDSVCRERKYLARTQAPPLETTRAWILDNIRKGIPQFVALEDTAVVGWCDIVPSDKDAFRHCGILGMGVVATHRRRGVGRRLLEATLRAARVFGLERVELDVYESNSAAVALYRAFGFTLEGTKVRACKIDGRYDNNLIMALFP
jgi:ribosomal protein S18 acetylase RimI-like enzyme